ncbi:MAG: hypothetical protein OXT71_18915 [Acidobacteriota bacterium]|nr:hypothetical protein [Acidobacteriota bacterium]
MSHWRRLYAKPAGAVPAALLTRIGGVVLALLCGLLILSQSFTGGGEEEAGEAPAQPANQALQQRAGARLNEMADREQQRRALEARQQLRERDRLAAAKAGRGKMAGLRSETGALAGLSLSTDQSEDPSLPPSEAELQLREQLRLEDLRRQHDSLRVQAVAHSYRDSEGAAAPESRTRPVEHSETPSRKLSEASPAPAQTTNDLTEQLDRLQALAETATQAALREVEADLVGATPDDRAPTGTEDPDRPKKREPEQMSAPHDPEGFERIPEGSFLEAVLVTQLSGDFPGPVLAQVSIPFYSRDRQSVLVPRGSRVIGAAQAVAHQDQSRMAVSFHRLILPSGQGIDLEFDGLNQLGESALKDQVDRHYFSMFAATGAVGVLSGLTLRGSQPYAGGISSLRAGAGQELGTASLRILERFLNRFPNITIRAGHRLRIWFTADVLVPRPTERTMTP